jgi:hypothetical protein
VEPICARASKSALKRSGLMRKDIGAVRPHRARKTRNMAAANKLRAINSAAAR